jgi:hypothetical protein
MCLQNNFVSNTFCDRTMLQETVQDMLLVTAYALRLNDYRGTMLSIYQHSLSFPTGLMVF